MDPESTIKPDIEGLKEFNKHFVLRDNGCSQKTTASEKEIVKQDSLELEQKKDELLAFQKSFKLLLKENSKKSKSQEDKFTLAVSTAPTHQRNKKRRPRPPKSRDFADIYRLTKEVLGTGAHSSVTTCIHRSTGKEFAVKVVPKRSSTDREKVLREVEILYLCRENRRILHLIEFFEDEKCFYLVFEKKAGGPLLSHIQKREKFTEREASQVVREVSEALIFLHQRGVAHRDLKPANVLCEKVDQVVPICICDFDLSSMVTSGSSAHATPVSTPMLHTPVGSAEFMAPEVVDTFLGEEFSYDKKCDLWSLGVTLYMMLCGQPPFKGACGRKCGWDKGENCQQCQDMLLTRIKNCEYTFPDDLWCGISDDAKDLISQLLKTDAKLRPSAEAVLQHPWLRQGVPDTLLHTPEVLSRYPSMPFELSNIAAYCLLHERRLSHKALESDQSECQVHKAPVITPRSFNLSPPGSSELALRREAIST